MAKTTQPKRETVHGIVAAFDHDHAYLLATAAEAFAATLDLADRHHPSAEMRSDADKLRDAAKALLMANATREFIERPES